MAVVFLCYKKFAPQCQQMSCLLQSIYLLFKLVYILLQKEFCIVVSLSDGTVACTSPSLTNVLGYPKDMWIGRSLINFLHPKDRIAFASHITSAMAHSHFKQKDTGTTFFPFEIILKLLHIS